MRAAAEERASVCSCTCYGRSSPRSRTGDDEQSRNGGEAQRLIFSGLCSNLKQISVNQYTVLVCFMLLKLYRIYAKLGTKSYFPTGDRRTDGGGGGNGRRRRRRNHDGSSLAGSSRRPDGQRMLWCLGRTFGCGESVQVRAQRQHLTNQVINKAKLVRWYKTYP